MALIRFVLAACASFAALVLVLPVLALALPFWLVASLTRAIARLLEPAYIPWHQVVEFDAAIGWKPRANMNTHYLTLEEPEIFSVRTDPQGWPGSLQIGDADVVVFGDSYAFGYGVDARAAFWEHPGPVRIKSIGAPAYNMVQELLLMRSLAAQLGGRHVVWFIYLGNDLLENLLPTHMHYRMPFVREATGRGGWEIVTSHVSPRKWPYLMEAFRTGNSWLGMRLDLHRQSFLGDRAYAACESLIREGQDVCRKSGARLTVMTIPDPVHVRDGALQRLAARARDSGPLDPDFPDARIGEMCSRLGVEFVAAKTFLESRHYKAVDPHWSEEGHRRIAEALWSVTAEANRPIETKGTLGRRHVLAS